MDFSAILAALGGAKKRGKGPLAPQGMPGMAGGPLAPMGGAMGGTQANQIPQALERIDPGASTALQTPGHMAGNLDGLPVNPAAPTPMEAVADLPLQGPLAPQGMGIDTYSPLARGEGGISLTPSARETMMNGPLAPAAPEKKRGGVFSRIGDFVKSDEGRGALLRGGAALLQGGSLGDAVMTGAAHVDARRKEGIDLDLADREFAQKDRSLDISQQGVDQQGLYQAGQLENSANQNLIRLMAEERQAQQFAERQGLDWARLSFDERRFVAQMAQREAEEAGRNYRHGTVSGSTAYAQEQANNRNAARIGAAGGGSVGSIIEAIPADEGGRTWSEFFAGKEPRPATPATRNVTKVMSLPSDPSQRVPGVIYSTPHGNKKWLGDRWDN